MKTYKNYIIDFGGVIYEISHLATYQSFMALAKDDSLLRKLELQQVLDFQIFIDYEIGKISSAEFRKSIISKFSLICSDEEFDSAWNKTLLGLFDYSAESIKKLKKNGNIFLLSNTNKIHFDYFYGECKEIFEMFDKCYYSFELGLRKPNSDIYDFVLYDLKINPEETIFLDDSQENLSGASMLGISTCKISKNLTLSDFLHSVENNTQQKP
jgi:FMN phosphatase YigB (HAD superfamily)